MQFNDGYQEEDGALKEINIVPLVDVMLVLLIIFMVTAPLSIGGIKIDLPASKAKSVSVDKNRIVLSIDREGRYFIDKLEVASAALEAKLKAIYEYREKKEIYIRADRGVEYGLVVDAMTAAKIAGVDKMSMLTKAIESKRAR
jgi:biopolymer transport protein TolR